MHKSLIGEGTLPKLSHVYSPPLHQVQQIPVRKELQLVNCWVKNFLICTCAVARGEFVRNLPHLAPMTLFLLLRERDLADQAFLLISLPLKIWFDPRCPVAKWRLMGISKTNTTIMHMHKLHTWNPLSSTSSSSSLLPSSPSLFPGISWRTFPVCAYKYSTPIFSPVSLKICSRKLR